MMTADATAALLADPEVQAAMDRHDHGVSMVVDSTDHTPELSERTEALCVAVAAARTRQLAAITVEGAVPVGWYINDSKGKHYAALVDEETAKAACEYRNALDALANLQPFVARPSYDAETVERLGAVVAAQAQRIAELQEAWQADV